MKSTHNSAIADELRWTMTRMVQDGHTQRTEYADFDLKELTNGYSHPFLVALKNALINSRNHLAVNTILNDYQRIKKSYSPVKVPA